MRLYRFLTERIERMDEPLSGCSHCNADIRQRDFRRVDRHGSAVRGHFAFLRGLNALSMRGSISAG
jgi:hypothetical protein